MKRWQRDPRTGLWRPRGLVPGRRPTSVATRHPEGLGRRGFLRGVARGALVTLALPWLEIFAGKQARAGCDNGLPKRLVVWFWGNGNRPDQWTPSGEGTGYTLSEELAPLAAFQDRLTVCSGFSAKVDNISPHWSGAAGILTGQQIDGDDDNWTVAGPTLDQVVAQEIGGSTVYRSMQVGVQSDEVYSYAGPNAPNYGETDPTVLFERLFGDSFRAPGENTEPDPALGYRRRVLDAVMEDVRALQAELGAEDRVRLEQHLDGVAALEDRLRVLQEDPPDLAACMRPDGPEESYPDIDGRPQIQAIHAAMAELVAMSLACDQTRVVTLQITRPLNNVLFPEATDGHHGLTHNEGGDQPEVHAITTYLMTCFADFLAALDAVPEADGTLLDNTVVLACSETSEGKTHSLDEMPVLLAGGGCGALARGTHIRSYTQENVGKVMLSVARSLDVNLATWGGGDAEVDEGVSELEL
jgi:hypothetical protein